VPLIVIVGVRVADDVDVAVEVGVAVEVTLSDPEGDALGSGVANTLLVQY
jgi:hypothetical protein